MQSIRRSADALPHLELPLALECRHGGPKPAGSLSRRHRYDARLCRVQRRERRPTRRSGASVGRPEISRRAPCARDPSLHATPSARREGDARARGRRQDLHRHRAEHDGKRRMGRGRRRDGGARRDVAGRVWRSEAMTAFYVYLLSDYEEHGACNVEATLNRNKLAELVMKRFSEGWWVKPENAERRAAAVKENLEGLAKVL